MSQTDEPEKIESEDKKETSFDDEQEEYQLNKDIPTNFSIEPLDFDKTPQRNKELHRFEQILNAPIYNIPMLIVEKHEDVLPLLSLYANEKNTGFLSVTPSVFDMDYMNFRDYHDVEKKMNKVGTILEYGDLNDEIPVYCDLLDYMEHELWKPFVENFLKSSRPFVIVARKEEASELKEEIEKDFKISGGLEKPAEPHIPQALAKVSELEISSLTNEEKKVYLTHYFNFIFIDNNLHCSDKNRDYLIREAIKRTSDKKELFDVFRTIDHLVVLAKQDGQTMVSRKLVNQALNERMPLHNRTKFLMDMDKRLKKQIFGQDEAIDKAYETILSTLDDEKREKPSVLAFFGPSGVGKTALAEEISLAMTGKKVVKINMAEYAESYKASILAGSAKGYVDSDEDGLLAKAIKENPNAVILLDEFEKAHPKVQHLFLGIFDKGSLFDNHAGQIDMSKATIILTSNAGVRPEQSLGFGASITPDYVADENAIKYAFPPELLGRLDAKILFNPLNESALEKIIDKYMMQINPRFEKLGVQVILSRKAKEELLAEGKNPMYGGRPILSLIRQKVKLPIEVGVLKKKIKKGNKVVVTSLQKDNLKVLPKQAKKVFLKPSKEL